MKRFELCFQFQGQDRYIVPEICPPEPSFPLPNFKDSSQMIRLEYCYEFMPKSIMTRFICRNHGAIKDEQFWPSGVVLDYDGTLALLQANEIKKKIYVTVSGKAAKEVLFLIRKEIEHIHDTIKKPPVSEMIPCICLECVVDKQPHMFKYETLKKYQDKNIELIRCDKSTEEISVTTLIEGIIDLKQYVVSPLNDYLNLTLVHRNENRYEQSVDQPVERKTRTIQIFLASSSELKEDRENFEIFIYRETKRLNGQGIFLNLNIWEDFIDVMSRTRLQDEYNKVIEECDVFVSLYFTKVGKYTAEEFEVAFKQFKKTDTPLIYTYFKDSPVTTGSISRSDINSLLDFKDKIKEIGHFYTSYSNIDDLKYQFKMQLDKILPTLTKR